MAMQQRKPTPEDFYNADHQEEPKPHEQRLPKTFERQPEPSRFDEPDPTDWFWFGSYWMVGIVIGLMGVAALMEMFKSYSWLLALSWTSTAVMGLGGLALIQKYWLRR